MGKERPLLTVAHYYPVINEMDFLEDYQKRQLDEAVCKSIELIVFIMREAWS